MKNLRAAVLFASLAFGGSAFAADWIAFVTPALAADMPVKALPAPASAFSWTGFYIGGNAGYGWKDPTVTFTPNDVLALAETCGGGAGSTCAPPASFGIRGGLGGFQIGYNWKPNQTWLVGVETDFDWSGIKGAGISNFLMTPALVPPGTSNFSVNENVAWFGTVRGRLGLTPTDRILVYGTAGFAYGRVKENISLNTVPGNNNTFGGFASACVAGSNCFLGASSRIATGWTIGGGAEYALSQNISVKGELLYVDLGSGDTVRVTAVNAGGAIPSSFSASFSGSGFYLARAGLNWKY